ncbi:MAG TPA: YcxB family protein [Pyrinomonadaceae bacterium]|jgi:hypothetical protein
MKEISIATRYTVEDHVRTHSFLKNLEKPSSFVKNFASVFFFFFGVLLLFMAGWAFVNREIDRALINAILGILTFFGVYKTLTLYNKFVRRFLYKRDLERVFDPNSVLFAERQIVFAEEGISETHELGNYLTRWDGIWKVIETNEDFFFYLQSTIRFQPKKDIPEGQIDALRILIKANLRENAAFERLTTG